MLVISILMVLLPFITSLVLILALEFRQLLTYSKYQQQSINPVSNEYHELLLGGRYIKF